MNTRNQDDSETEVKKVDRFGFVVKASENKQELAKRSTLKRDNARIEKWRAMLPKLESMIAKRDKKLKKRIRKGIPDSFRTKVWPMLARIEQKKNNSNIEYQALLTMNTTYMEDIQKDVYRTFPNHPFFAVRDGPGQKGLENVLKALSITYKEMGYCQGLNFVCALLVLYCNDEEAYWMMNALISTYNLEDYYRDLNYVKKPLFVLDELIKAHFPKVGKQMAKLRIEGLFYATGWIMTLYSNFLPFNLVVRLFDCFLFEEFKILYRIGLAIIKIKKKKILKCTSMEQILGHLKNFEEPEFHNDDQFLKIAFGISLSRKEIQKIQLRYRPK